MRRQPLKARNVIVALSKSNQLNRALQPGLIASAAVDSIDDLLFQISVIGHHRAPRNAELAKVFLRLPRRVGTTPAASLTLPIRVQGGKTCPHFHYMEQSLRQ
jgi:hypothetical protein